MDMSWRKEKYSNSRTDIYKWIDGWMKRITSGKLKAPNDDDNNK